MYRESVNSVDKKSSIDKSKKHLIQALFSFLFKSGGINRLRSLYLTDKLLSTDFEETTEF